MNAVSELEEAYRRYKDDPEFNRELQALYHDYANRPSLLYYADKMTKDLGGAKIYIKREDLNHTGAHKINNVLGQILLAKRMGKKESSLRQVPASTVLQPLRYVLSSGLSAVYTWELKIHRGSHLMYTEWSFSVPRLSLFTVEPGLSRMQ